MKLYPVVFMLSWGREDFSAPVGDFEKLPWRSWEKRTLSYQKGRPRTPNCEAMWCPALLFSLGPRKIKIFLPCSKLLRGRRLRGAGYLGGEGGAMGTG